MEKVRLKKKGKRSEKTTRIASTRTTNAKSVKKGEGEGVYEVKRKREGREERRKVGMNPWRRTEAYKEARKNRK